MEPVIVEHKHVIIRAEVNSPPGKDDTEMMKDWVIDLVDSIGMKLLSGPHVEYVDVPGNVGMTTVSIIETSHIAIHTWEEPDPALMQIDVYTCGPLDLDVVWEKLETFEPIRVYYKFLDREFTLKDIDEGGFGTFSLNKDGSPVKRTRSAPTPIRKSQGITSAHNV